MPVDHERLGRALKVLASPNRLRLIELLREPREIETLSLAPEPGQDGTRVARRMSRQGVRHHLEQLRDAGLCRSRPTGTGPAHAWVADHAQLFAIAEDLRVLASRGQPRIVRPGETADLAAPEEAHWPDGPKVVLVHGVDEGRAHALEHGALHGERGWTIGRRSTCHVPITFDPYVSGENAEIIPTADGFRLLDLRTAKNGTYLNWRRLPVGGQAPLEGGDVIGIGRTLLVFRPR